MTNYRESTHHPRWSPGQFEIMQIEGKFRLIELYCVMQIVVIFNYANLVIFNYANRSLGEVIFISAKIIWKKK